MRRAVSRGLVAAAALGLAFGPGASAELPAYRATFTSRLSDTSGSAVGQVTEDGRLDLVTGGFVDSGVLKTLRGHGGGRFGLS